MKPSITLCINQKVGIGKTTIERETGFYLASKGKNVLLVDSDPQGNLTKSLIENVGCGLYDALEDDILHITKVRENLSLLSADTRLSAFADRLTSEKGACSRFNSFFRKEEFNQFDYIFIDIPPGFGVLTINVLSIADYIMISLTSGIYGMHGSNDIMGTIDKARKQLNSDQKILGVVLICVNERPTIIKEIIEEIVKSFGKRVFNVYLSRSVKIEEVIASKIGLIELNEDHKLKEEAIKIGQELLKKLEDLKG